MKCKCDKFIITTNFCPDCGKNQKTRPRRYPVYGHRYNNHKLAIKTNQYRKPKVDEYFLSGAKPMAYKASHNMGTKFWIAEIIK